MDQEFILIHIGTNDVITCKGGIPEMHHYLHMLVREIKKVNLYSTIAISSVLPRPRDSKDRRNKDSHESARMQANAMIHNYTRAHDYEYIESWRALTKADGTTDRDLFAWDLLHLNHDGALALQLHLEGFMGSLQQIKRDKE
jgi:lysophospholipase L1-like esterase